MKEDDFKWQPWEDYKTTIPAPKLPITAPPCPHCKCWNPQPRYWPGYHGFVFNGVRLCHANEMEHDFSCFQRREA
jgi:hypothetical protein